MQRLMLWLVMVLVLAAMALPAANAQPSPPPGSAGPRVALVVGNAQYRHVSALPNAVAL